MAPCGVGDCAVGMPEWVLELCSVAGAQGQRLRGSVSGVELVGDGLVPLEFGDGVGLERIDGGRLIEAVREEIGLGWCASGGRGGGLCGS